MNWAENRAGRGKQIEQLLQECKVSVKKMREKPREISRFVFHRVAEAANEPAIAFECHKAITVAR